MSLVIAPRAGLLAMVSGPACGDDERSSADPLGLGGPVELLSAEGTIVVSCTRIAEA